MYELKVKVQGGGGGGATNTVKNIYENVASQRVV
jgi:hypothetical protein